MFPRRLIAVVVAAACATGSSAFQLPSTVSRLAFENVRHKNQQILWRAANENVGRVPLPRASRALRAPVALRMAGVEQQSALYSLHVCLQVKPERRGEFLTCIEANQRGTMMSEPLAVRYLFGEDENMPNTFHFYEAYKSREGFEAHTKTPHFSDWESFVATEPLSAEPQVTFYTESVFEGNDSSGTRLPNLTIEHYCLNVCLCVKPERRNEFLECIQANQRGTITSEPLAVTYLYGEDESTPNKFHLFEAYKGRAGFEAHTKAPHFAKWEEFVATEPLSASPQLAFYNSRPFAK